MFVEIECLHNRGEDYGLFYIPGPFAQDHYSQPSQPTVSRQDVRQYQRINTSDHLTYKVPLFIVIFWEFMTRSHSSWWLFGWNPMLLKLDEAHTRTAAMSDRETKGLEARGTHLFTPDVCEDEVFLPFTYASQSGRSSREKDDSIQPNTAILYSLKPRFDVSYPKKAIPCTYHPDFCTNLDESLSMCPSDCDSCQSTQRNKNST